MKKGSFAIFSAALLVFSLPAYAVQTAEEILKSKNLWSLEENTETLAGD